MKNKKLPKEKSAVENLANVCTLWNKSSHTLIFLLLNLMGYFGPQILFYAIWNKGFLDHAHLTDGMQWQKKSKKHIYIAQCSSLMRFEHFGRAGGFLFCGITNKKFLKFLKFDFEVLHPRLL